MNRAATHLGNTALLRLKDGECVWEGLTRLYLPRRVFWLRSDGVTDGTCHWSTWELLAGFLLSKNPLDLSEPGTAMGARNALGLALGLDPGESGVGCAWSPIKSAGQHYGWFLSTVDDARYFVRSADYSGDTDDIVCDAVANEKDSAGALALAIQHVLES
jgi:hypothetical protein